MNKDEVILIKNLASFENLVNQSKQVFDLNMMVMPGTLEDKHKDIDPVKGIRALRRQFNLIYILTEGEHDVMLGADYQWLKPNDLVIVPENMVYASQHIRNCKGFCIHFKTEFIQSLFSGPITEDFPFFQFEAEHIINLKEKDSLQIQQAFRDIIAEYQSYSNEKDIILRNLIHILLLRIREIYRPYVKQIMMSSSRASRLANTFKHMLERDFIKNRSVQKYASELNISSKYLYDVVKATFGKTPRDFINDMLLLEAKVQLGSTDKTISEIAFELQFDDQAHFSHFIKQKTGMSPIALRQIL
ncbi:MAG: AraC family transcriptional regulator [Saprospiraceae bacterium]|uniref:AraC family transcriptional regulator n=1 Tax=Candidatus Defluviibacterium haderslevense TaxID=2981993 RepID=A0A9D7SAX2_9BACT|nr:AraC family transcriptional regulator [Candidatus Defluviibacterium haderslevense]